MKKHITLFIFSIFLSANIVNAQDKFASEWNIGVGFGPTFSSLSIEPAIDTKSKMQYFGGLAIRYISEKNLGLIAELNYSQQGWEQDFKKIQNNTTGFEYTQKLNYLELPILTHIYFGNKVRFFVNLGPKFGFLLSEDHIINDKLAYYLANIPEGETPSFQTEHFGKKAEKKFDYGLQAGAGVEFRSKIGHFALEGRYSFGLGDIYSSKKTDIFSRSANRVMAVKLTYYTKLF